MPVQTHNEDIQQFLDYAKQIEKKLDNLEKKIASQEHSNSNHTTQPSNPKPDTRNQSLQPVTPPAPQVNRPQQPQPQQVVYRDQSPKPVAVRRVPKLRPRIVETFRPRVVETRELRPAAGRFASNRIIEGSPYVEQDQRYLPQQTAEFGGLAEVETVLLTDSYSSPYSRFDAAPAYGLLRSNSGYFGADLHQTGLPVYSSAARLAYAPVEATPGIIPRTRNNSLSSASFRGY